MENNEEQPRSKKEQNKSPYMTILSCVLCIIALFMIFNCGKKTGMIMKFFQVLLTLFCPICGPIIMIIAKFGDCTGSTSTSSYGPPIMYGPPPQQYSPQQYTPQQYSPQQYTPQQNVGPPYNPQQNVGAPPQQNVGPPLQQNVGPPPQQYSPQQ